MKRKTHKAGTFIRIKLPDGTYAYGRELDPPYTAFYAYRTEAPSQDLDAIQKHRVLFRQAVRVRGADAWEAIGVRELTGEVANPVVQFQQEIGDFRKCTIFDSDGNERIATPRECVGLERAAVWEAHHVEERLLDTFEGRQNATEQRLRVRLE
jgi:hypothetical protein